jgi:hypothetical protein
MSLGFTKSKADPNLYYKVVDGGPVILLLYVDDMFLTGDEKLITESKRKLTTEFKMKDLGMMHYFLGLEVWQKLDKIFLSQGKYVVEILKRFEMMDCKSMPIPIMTNIKLLSDTTCYRTSCRLGKARPNHQNGRQLREHLPTVTLGRCSHHFRGEIVTSRGESRDPRGNEVENVMYERMPL